MVEVVGNGGGDGIMVRELHPAESTKKKKIKQ
jgi:hypothetical protein